MRILVIFNNDALIEQDADDSFLCLNSRKSIESVAQAVTDTLKRIGNYQVVLAAITELEQIEEKVVSFRPELIFNLCESLQGDAKQEISVVRLLEKLNIPFTGNGSRALELALDKYLCNSLLTQADIPMPHSFLLKNRDDLEYFEFKHDRYIVKPNDEDGSTGIDFNSVVKNKNELKNKVSSLWNRSPSHLLVQEYIEGREVNFSFLGQRRNSFWCASEISFHNHPKHLPKILNYSSKWLKDSPEFGFSQTVHAPLEGPFSERLIRSVQVCNETLGITSYGRIDFKINEQGVPFIIDVNPNCDLDPGAGLALANGFQGTSYSALIVAIMQHAITRFNHDH